MRGSHFIVQTSKFLLIDATAMILGQGHRKVIQYIFLIQFSHERQKQSSVAYVLHPCHPFVIIDEILPIKSPSNRKVLRS